MTGQQLKNSILQEAIQGRLVPNVLESGEKTGAELLQDILVERQKKENAEKGQKAKKLTLSTVEEEPWELPEGWCWCKLGDLADRLVGKTPERANTAYWSSGTKPWVSISDMQDYGVVTSTKECVSPLAEKDVFSNRISKKGSLIMSFKLTVGRTCILGIDAYHNEAIATFLLPEWLHPLKMYLFWLLPFFTNFSESKDAVKGKTLNKDSINATDIPLPPLSIQKAIVAKIEELFPIVDEYDKANGELEELNQTLPDKLRKSVLQEAIHGNLVPNDIPEGESTASELLQQILKERQEKEDKEKGKKAKKLTLSTIEEEPWELPEGWCWTLVKDICDVKGGKRIPAGRRLSDIDTGYKYIRVSDMKNGSILTSDLKYVPIDIVASIKRYTISKDDIYITVAGTIGDVGTVPEELDGANLTENADKLVFSNRFICKEWLYVFLKSPFIKQQIKDVTTKVGQPKLAINKIEELILPLPPLSIQHRIVEKIEEVFAAIDKLKS
jgi:type I restriction enzyme S subunit